MIYIDNNATTKIDAEVLEVMMPFLKENYGNASSKSHSLGWIAEEAVENSRQQIADLINADSQEIIFTSGATESLNIAIQGLYRELGKTKNEIIVCTTEHNAVLETCNHLSEQGIIQHQLNVNREGLIDIDELKKLINKNTLFVAVMLANNETGVINNAEEISKVVHAFDSFFMCDATQAIGKINVDVQELGIDLMPLSAHKFYGPKGIGALYIRRKNPRVTLHPLSFGGGHEKLLRPGTLNVASIVGMGKAAQLAQQNLWNYAALTSHLRTRLEHHFQYKFGTNVYINGSIKNRLPNTTNILFVDKKATEILSQLPFIAASTGSACASAISKPSHVLTAMRLSESEAYGSIRFSFGKYNSVEEVEEVALMFEKILPKVL